MEEQCGAAFFEEATELNDIVQRVVSSEGKDALQVYDRYKVILTKYQEQSQLLDAYLEEIVVPLATLLRAKATQELDDAALQAVLNTCRLLAVLVFVRGFKMVVKFFPHEAADLERVVQILQVVRTRPTPDAEEALASWEAQAMLLLWLSILILIPFDLATVDSHALGGETAGKPYTALVGSILSLCKAYLQQPGGVREMSAVVLGRLLTRPDMGGALSEFLDWCPGALEQVDNLHAPFLLPGMMQALCYASKLGQRDRLLPYAHRTWTLLGFLAANPQMTGNVLARKLSIKLRQRIGLTFLAPRLAPWRYVRSDNASLDLTLRSAAGTATAPAAAATGGDGDDGDDDDDDIEIVEEMEDVIEGLLAALRDKDTVVRWSGAKGIGRITGCLPKELGDDVVASVLELFRPAESDAAWHGGCLALAELARRGLLLPVRLPALTPLIRSALAYDVRRGAHSIGAHVRDAAAYVCWAFARAYAPELLQDKRLPFRVGGFNCVALFATSNMPACVHFAIRATARHILTGDRDTAATDSVSALASSLLAVACYDREVNCRRAAAAGFQEAVGRLGNVPHGIAVLSIADYFSVGITQQAYLRVAPQVAAFPDYREALARHLVEAKSRHWDKPLRELAARGAAALVPHHPQYFAGPALDQLLPACLNDVLEVRHGAVMFVAELLPALAAADAAAAAAAAAASSTSAADPAAAAPALEPLLSAERQAAIAGLVPAIDKARLYRGKGGEIMREAVSRLIECMSKAALPMGPAQHAKVLEALDENMRSPKQYIQAGAVAALRAYSRAYLVHDKAAAASFRTRFLDKYMSSLHDPNVAVRRGNSLALGALPRELLQPVLEEAIDALVDGCTPEEDADERDVESRANCTMALGRLCETAFGSAGPSAEGAELLREKVIPCLITSLADYTTDNRGDVGSWVREAAMAVLNKALQLTARCLPPEEHGEQLPGLCAKVVGLLLKQSVERISRVREAAVLYLAAILANATVAQHVPAAGRVAAAIPGGAQELGAATPAADAAAAASRADGAEDGNAKEAAADGDEDGDGEAAPASSSAAVQGGGATAGGGGAAAGATTAAALAAGGLAASLDALHRTAQLLDVPAYTSPLLEGLVASIGCIDNSLAKAAAAALIDAVSSPRGVLEAVAAQLLDVWSVHTKSSRMAGPLLRTADLLVTRSNVHAVWLERPPPAQAAPAAAAGDGATAAEAAPPPRSRFIDHLVEHARAETRMCADVPRLVDATTLLCRLIAYPGHCRTSALQGLMVLLASKFPKVRRHAAEQLYLQLLSVDPAAAGAQDPAAATGAGPALEQVADEASDLVLTTVWDGDVEAAKAARDQLAALMGVQVPKMKAAAGGGAQKAAAKDEQQYGYQALLDDFARGL